MGKRTDVWKPGRRNTDPDPDLGQISLTTLGQMTTVSTLKEARLLTEETTGHVKLRVLAYN